MEKLTREHPSSFIPGRSTIDNIIVVQELVHTLMKKKVENGGFVLKVDLEKAYDKVDWGFLREVLRATGFKSHIIHLIMDCVTSASLAVCWNREVFPTFSLSRGLR